MAPAEVGARHAEVAGALCMSVSTAPGARELNRALGVRDAAALAAVTEWFGGAPHVVCGAAGLEAELAAAGYASGYAWMRFVRAADRAAAAPTDLRIAEAGPEWARPVALAFGLPESFEGWLGRVAGRPGWTCVAAYDEDGTAVGGGAVYVAGEQAYVGFGGTLLQARGRGAQSALLARRIAVAAEQGATECVSETGVVAEGRPSNSYRNILRAGFAEAEVRPNWDFR